MLAFTIASTVSSGASASAVSLPSLRGPVGLYRVSTAEVGEAGDLRLALHGEMFRSSGFLVQGDVDTRLAGALAAGFTPIGRLEVFASLAAAENRNERLANGAPVVEGIGSLGRLVAGAKGIASFGRRATGGLELGLGSPPALLSSPTTGSVWLTGIVTVRPRVDGPFRLHANGGVILDNSRSGYDFTGLPLPARQTAIFGHNIQRDRLRFGLAADLDLDRSGRAIAPWPFAEYHFEWILAAPDPAFADLRPANRDQHWLTLGLRVRAGAKWVVDLGVDVALRSAGFPAGAPLPPYNVVVGAACSL